MNATATTIDTTPRIWRACLACYNNGNLVGQWIPATDSAAIETFQQLHEEKTGHEEYAVHDYDGMVDLGEYPSMEDLGEWGNLVELHGFGPVSAFIDVYGKDYARPDDFEEAFQGVHDSEQDFAEQLADDLGLLSEAPETLARYFDWEAWTRDLFMGDYSSSYISGEGYAIFRTDV